MDWAGSVCGGVARSPYVFAPRWDAPLFPELTVGANGDEVDWTFLPPPEIVLSGVDER